MADKNIRMENEKRIQKLLEMNAKLSDQLNNLKVDTIPQAGNMPSYLPSSVETAIRNRLEGSKEKINTNPTN